MNLEKFKSLVNDWKSNFGFMHKTYIYKRGDVDFTAEVYTKNTPTVDGVYIMLDDLNVTITVIQREALNKEEFNKFSNLISATSDLIEKIEFELNEELRYDEVKV